MPCPHHSVASNKDRGIDRREFVKAAVAIGGASALAFVEHESADPQAESEVLIKNHGIQGHFQAERRGTSLVAPRSLRALPPASP